MSNNTFYFSVNDKPYPKERPRAKIVGGYAKIYTPSNTQKYEKKVKNAFLKECFYRNFSPQTFFKKDIALKVELTFYLPIPVKMSQVQHRACLQAVLRPKSGGDVDNLAKSFLDALNGVAWQDDRQIVELVVKKYYGAIGMSVCIVTDITGNYEKFKAEDKKK